MQTYEALVLGLMIMINTAVAIFGSFTGYCIVKFEAFRKEILSAAQDGDEVTHSKDGKNVVYLILGVFSAWFTANVAGIFLYSKMFDYGPLALFGLLAGITFALLGIAWKGNENHKH